MELTSIFEHEVSPSVMRELEAAYPEGRIKHWFACKLPIEDPRLHRIQSVLKSAGLSPRMSIEKPIDKTSQYYFRIRRSYQPPDFSSLRFVELITNVGYEGNFRTEDEGLLLLDGYEPHPIPSFAVAGRSSYIIPQSTKDRLAESGLRGLRFRPTIVVERPYGQFRELPQTLWYELCAERSMPRLSDSMFKLGSERPRPLPTAVDFVRKEELVESLYLSPELHYRDSDLNSLEEADIYHMHEVFGGDRKWLDRQLIVTKRFYNFCRANDLDTEWVPVRIDE